MLADLKNFMPKGIHQVQDVIQIEQDPIQTDFIQILILFEHDLAPYECLHA